MKNSIFSKAGSLILVFVLLLTMAPLTGLPAAAEEPFKTEPMVAAGGAHTAALTSNGTVWTWGGNWHGELGDGTDISRTTPVQVQGLTDVTAITAGDFHTVALKSNGTVWAWGGNKDGQLGDGTTTDRYTPVQVQSLTGVVGVAAGDYHTVALKSDGTVWVWGGNWTGQLGDGTAGWDSYKTTPVQVKNLADLTAIAAGGYHTVALKSDGTMWVWGGERGRSIGGRYHDRSICPHAGAKPDRGGQRRRRGLLYGGV